MVNLASLELAADPPDCVRRADSACGQVWDLTHTAWLAQVVEVIASPAKILVIIVAAIVIRLITHRAINRVVNSTVDRADSAGERSPTMVELATGFAVERRKQRAGAIGSILRSVASVTIFAIAFVMILGELGFDLAPVLATAGIAGVALGFGAQTLVKDVLSGIFMLLEDQYGVGDIVDVGEASGTVEAVGLRITTLRDVNGVVWYVRNGEVIRVGNKSQGWAVVNVDVPLPFGTDVEEAVAVLRPAVAEFAADETWAADVLEPPEVLGVEQMTPTGMLLRITVKTTTEAQWRVAREVRARAGAVLEEAGISVGLPMPPPPPAV